MYTHSVSQPGPQPSRAVLYWEYWGQLFQKFVGQLALQSILATVSLAPCFPEPFMEQEEEGREINTELLITLNQVSCPTRPGTLDTWGCLQG